MKKRTNRGKDIILNMLPAPQRQPLPVPKNKKKQLPEMGSVGADERRAHAMLRRSSNMGVLQASQFAGPISDGAFISLGDQPMEVRANQGGQKVKAGLKIEAGNTATLMPFFHTPGNAQDAYNLPKTYVEQIRWSRLMYNLNAYLGAITDLRAYYALSKFKLVTSEPAVTEFYSQVAFNKNFNLYEFILRMSLNLQKFGEAIAWGARKQAGVWPKTGQPIWVWDYFIMLEPELVEIKKDLVGSNKPRFYLRPSRDMEELVDKLDANDSEYARYADKIPETIREKIRKKESIQLDENTISAIQNLTDASATRGTPPYQRLFTTFILEDFTRLAQMAQANRYHFPMELWTLGDLEKNILPNQADLDRLRDLVTDAIQQPPFSLFLPPIVKYEALGVQGKTFPFKDDYDYIWQQYMVGLGVSQTMILGEALALDTPIPTPTGWTTMGELRVGDKVFSRDGSVTEVIALSPIWEDRPTYKVSVEFSAPIVADENHKWVVGFNRGENVTDASGKKVHKNFYGEAVLDTKHLAEKVKLSSQGQSNFQVPMHRALDLPPAELPVPPYTLGAWLGDGDTRAHGQYTCHPKDEQIINNIRLDGFEVTRGKGGYDWFIKKLAKRLRSLGLAYNKHIPREYLRASYAQRLALVQGLMDADGTCGRLGCCSFDNTNRGLVEDMRELLLTLGIKPSEIATKADKRKASYLPMYRITFTIGMGQPMPFRLDRKALRASVTGHTKSAGLRPSRRPIREVVMVESVPTRCIQVAHPSGSFLAGTDFIVTHNSGIFASAETSSNQAFIRARKFDRDRLEDWMTWNFFEPLARWNNLRLKKGNQLVPILPDYEWEKTLDYTAEEQEREDAKWLWEKGVYPTKGLLGKLRENPDELEKQMESELDTIFDDGKRIAAPAIRKRKGEGGGLPGEDSMSPGAPMGGEGDLGGPPAAGAGGGAAPLMAPEAGGGAPEAPPAGVGDSAGAPAPSAGGGPAITESPEIL